MITGYGKVAQGEINENHAKSRNFLITLVINMFALAITAWLVPGIHTPASFL